MNDLASSIEQVRARITSAAEQAGRRAADITLVAVTKTVAPARIAEAMALGLADFGENKAQELVVKVDAVQAPQARWHFIGTLQRNKVASVLDRVVLIHSVDSLALAEAINRRAAQRPQPAPILLQVNASGDPSKHGLQPQDAEDLAAAVRGMAGLDLKGLMTIGSAHEPERTRDAFAAVRQLRDRLGLEELSMGMTHDFEIGIEEGATIVRIGTAIFGERPAKPERPDATSSPGEGTNG